LSWFFKDKASMDWSKINHKQFEDIAHIYAQDTYKEFTWVSTKQTRDGNKDGEFITGIETINLIIKGWYEAKYTEKPHESIAKSHMDSTLVSGILDGTVSLILFITNGKINKEFRRRAEAILSPYKTKVSFIEGDILEDWIAKKSFIRENYFCDYGDNDIIEFIEIDDVCFFDAIMSPSTLASPVSRLITENEYYLYISLRANFSTFVDINISNTCLMHIPNKNMKTDSLQINPGYNSFWIKFCARHEFSGYLNINILIDNEVICHKNLQNLCIESNYEPLIVYSQQTAIIHDIFNYMVLNTMPACILSISGKEGTGKSHLLRGLQRDIIKQNSDSLVIQMSEKLAENACSLCKLILFLGFGNLHALSKEAFLEMIQQSTNLPYEIYIDLREGASDQIIASSVIKKLIKTMKRHDYSLLPEGITLPRESISQIFIDDFHKVSVEHSKLFITLFNDFLEKAKGQIIILGFRPEEFHDEKLEYYIESNKEKNWTLRNVTNNDIDSSIEKNLNKNIVDIAKFFPSPVNILHLNLLIKKLIEKSIVTKTYDSQIICFQNSYKETNIQNGSFAKNKIKNCKFIDLIYVIYKIESGVPVELLREFYGEKFTDAFKELKSENLVRHESGIIRPFHDVYLYAFSDITFEDKFSAMLNNFLNFCMTKDIKNTVIESNILSVFVAMSNIHQPELIESMTLSCEQYYTNSQYDATCILADKLLPNFGDTSPLDYTNNELRLLYLYAQSLKYSQTHIGSNQYFIRICEIGKFQSLDSIHMGYVFDAYSELLVNALWLLDKEKSFQYIEYLEIHINKKISNDAPIHKVNAYLNLLNRKMLYSAMFQNGKNYEILYQNALKESKRLMRNDYVGYAMMDKAKHIIYYNASEALPLLESAYDFFCTSDAYLKRRYDCLSEIVFTKVLLNDSSFDLLYAIQRDSYMAGLLHVYAKTTLKILFLELSKGMDLASIESRLTHLIVQYPEVSGIHRLSIAVNSLWSAIHFKKGNHNMQKKYALKQLKISKRLCESYQIVAIHNSLNLDTDKIQWIKVTPTPLDKNSFWIDSRIW